MSDSFIPFVDAARRFCRWVESRPHSAEEARRLLLELLLTVSEIMEEDASGLSGRDYPRLEYSAWQGIFQGLSDLPLAYYRQVYAPCDLEEESSVVGHLGDDLADIYGDLWQGFQAFDAGDAASACWYWKFSYESHWSHHAAGAIYALDAFCRGRRSQ